MTALALGLGLPQAAAGEAPGWVARDGRGRPAFLDLDYDEGRFWLAGRSYADEAALLAAAGGERLRPAAAWLPLPAVAGEIGYLVEVTTPAELPPEIGAEILAFDKDHLSSRLDLTWREWGEVLFQMVDLDADYEEAVAAPGTLGVSTRLRLAASARNGRHAVARDGDGPSLLAGAAHLMPGGLSVVRIGMSISGYSDFAGTFHRVALFANAPGEAELLALSAPDDAIVAWGDSLTAAAFAGDDFAELFAPARKVTNAGVGGQTSPQIAARQGGVPIALTVEDDLIPAGDTATVVHDFEAGLGDWSGRVQDEVETGIAVADGALVVAEAGFLQGPELPLGPVATGDTIGVEFDLAIEAGSLVEVGIVWGAGGGWASTGNGVFDSPGRKSVMLSITGDHADAHLTFLNPQDGATSAFALDNVAVTSSAATPEPVTVTARSVSPITHQGPGPIAGWLCGVHGTLAGAPTADDSENDSAAYTFTRDEAGAAVACPPGSRFLPDSATIFRRQVALLWAGRNNAADPARVKADIAAMAARVAGGRYLVGSVLTGDGDGPAIATITALNAALAAAHGDRFVDVLGALLAAHDGSADDLADVAAGITPRSLRSDHIHLNETGRDVARAAWHDAVVGLGF